MTNSPQITPKFIQPYLLSYEMNSLSHNTRSKKHHHCLKRKHGWDCIQSIGKYLGQLESLFEFFFEKTKVMPRKSRLISTMNRFSVKLTFRVLYVILKKITFPSRFASAFSRNRITPVSIAMRTITPIRASNAVTPSITWQFAMFALVTGKTLTFA